MILLLGLMLLRRKHRQLTRGWPVKMVPNDFDPLMMSMKKRYKMTLIERLMVPATSVNGIGDIRLG